MASGLDLSPSRVVNPRSFIVRKSEYKKTHIKKGATIGANATVVCGKTIGEYAFIGAGSVVTHNIPSNAIYAGNPAKFIQSIDEYYEKCCNNVGNLENSVFWEDYLQFEKFGKKSKKDILIKYFQNK